MMAIAKMAAVCMAAASMLVTCMAASGAESASQYHVDVQELMKSDNTLVVRLSIRAPRSKSTEMTSLDFRWRDQLHITAANGMWKQTDTERQADVLIVVQAAAKTAEHPGMVMISTQQESEGKAHSFSAHKLQEDAKPSELIKLEAKSGDYRVAEPLTVMTVGGQAMSLTVVPFPTEEKAVMKAPVSSAAAAR